MTFLFQVRFQDRVLTNERTLIGIERIDVGWERLNTQVHFSLKTYTLGKGLKVIYTCKEKDFNETHFDTNHFPHINYNTPDELKKKRLLDMAQMGLG